VSMTTDCSKAEKRLQRGGVRDPSLEPLEPLDVTEEAGDLDRSLLEVLSGVA